MAKTLTIGGHAVYHPAEEFASATRLGTTQSFWGKANSYRCPRGKEPGKAWLLVPRATLTELQESDANYFRLLWRDSVIGPQDTTLFDVPLLQLVAAHNISLSRPSDPHAAMLIELADVRRDFQYTTLNDQYNVRRPAPNASSGTGLYYTDSLNGGSLWTWQTMLDDIWGNLPSATAGTAPTLPYTPDAPPEDWRFIGTNAWDALHQVLERIGCITIFDPFNSTFDYVRLGTTQTAGGKDIDDVLTDLEKFRKFDYDSTDFDFSSVPETIRVFFHRRELYHGAEKDTPNASNWEMSPVETKDYATGITAPVGSVMSVWSDLPALTDTSGTVTNDAALTTRANEIGANIKARIRTSPLRIHYAGLLFPGKLKSPTSNILPGAQISEIVWRDYGDMWGIMTEVMQQPTMQDTSTSGVELFPRGRPLWPRLGQPVQADDGATTTGDDLTANAGDVYPGFVLRYNAATPGWETLEACWIRPADLEPGASPSEATIVPIRQKDRFNGRLSGSQDVGGDVRPVYTVRTGAGEEFEFSVTGDEGGPCTITHGDTIDFDATGLSYTTEANSTVNLRGLVVRVDDNDPICDVSFAVDKSVAQNVDLAGSFTVGTVLVRNGTRNTVTFNASAGDLPPINLAEGAAGIIDVTPRNPFHTITNHDASDSEDLEYQDTLEFKNDNGVDPNSVSRAGSTTTVRTLGYPPLGTIWLHYKKPILEAGKYYMDSGDGLTADTDWALMDGSSNSSPGSGITMGGTGTGANDPAFFVRAHNRRDEDGSNTARGRANETTDDDHHNDLAQVTLSDHDNHEHTITTDVCDDAFIGSDTPEQYEFGTQNPQTSGVTAVGGGAAGSGVLGHSVTIENRETTSATDKLQMLPPYKTLHFYERVASGSNTT